jgi:asparagine synthase (glutamine-hydrolysing)
MVDGLLLDGRMRARGVFDDRAVARVWQEHRDGRQDHRHRLWSLVMLELWFRQFVDGARAETFQASVVRGRGEAA